MSTSNVPPIQAIIIEMLLTFLILKMLVNPMCGFTLATRLTVFVCQNVIWMQFTGSSINLARSIVYCEKIWTNDGWCDGRCRIPIFPPGGKSGPAMTDFHKIV